MRPHWALFTGNKGNKKDKENYMYWEKVIFFVAEFVRIRVKLGNKQNLTVDSVTELKSENLVVI